jgi:maltose-binding protein MalE
MFYYRLFFLIICSFIVFLLFGCGKETGDSIVFRHSIKDPAAIRILNELILEFNKQHNTNIIQAFSDDDDIAGYPDSSWDIALIPAHRTAWYTDNGFIADLNPGDSIINTINRFSKEASYCNGKLYSIPLFMDVYILLSNAECINTDDLTDLTQLPYSSDLSSNPDSIPGFAVAAFGREAFYNLILFFQLGQTINDTSNYIYNRVPIHINNFNLYLQSGYENGFESQGMIFNKLLRGEIASCLSNSAVYSYLKTFNNPDIFASELPDYMGKSSNSLISCLSFVVNSKSNNKQVSEKFISFLISDAISLRLAKEIKYLGFPANINLASIVRNTDSFRNTQYKQVNHAKALGSHPSFYLIEKYLDSNLGECIYGQISPWEILSNIGSIQDSFTKD